MTKKVTSIFEKKHLENDNSYSIFREHILNLQINERKTIKQLVQETKLPTEIIQTYLEHINDYLMIKGRYLSKLNQSSFELRTYNKNQKFKFTKNKEPQPTEEDQILSVIDVTLSHLDSLEKQYERLRSDLKLVKVQIVDIKNKVHNLKLGGQTCKDSKHL